MEYYSINMPIKEIMSNPELAEKLIGINDDLFFFDDEVHLEIFGGDTILKLNKTLNLNFSKKDLSEIETILSHTPIKNERKF